MPRTKSEPVVVTTIRATPEWLRELDGWAARQGLSRMASILVTSRVGRRVLDRLLDRLQITQDELRELIGA
jgi:hypothetical protein